VFDVFCPYGKGEDMIRLLKRLAKKIEELSEHVYGYEIDEDCNRGLCPGIIEREDGSCCCSAINNPPCGYCENNEVYCPECGWEGST
jgi:hypothetical protein